MHKKQTRPDIEVASTHYDRLAELAVAAHGRSPGAQCLAEELDRARVVAELPAARLGINDVVTFEYDGLNYYDVQLVFPKDADFKNRRLSVLTPVGAMLLGLAEGQAIHWYGADGRSHRISVEKVSKATGGDPIAAEKKSSSVETGAWPFSGLDLNA